MVDKELIAVAACAALLVSCGNTDSGAAKSTNPLATADQLQAEKTAIDLVASDEVKTAKAAQQSKWIASAAALSPVSDESLQNLSQSIDESAYASAIALSNTDPYQPKVISNLAAPHDWFDVKVPGSRTIFDNPDTIYRRIPIDPTASYIVHGTVHAHGPVDFNFSLWNSSNATIANIAAEELKTDSNGNFTITLNASANDGNANHFQLPATAATLFIRDTVNDWGVQQFNTLSVERLSGGTAGAKTRDQLITAAAAGVRNNLAVFSYYNQLAYAQPVNTLPSLSYGGTNGRLATQIATYSAFKLADDEALVLTVALGGAKYFIAPAYNRWMITTDYIKHTQSLNNKQAVANADGTYTFVIAPKDPGVYNWVDTVGLHEGLLNLRWQGLPTTATAVPPSAKIKLVKQGNLNSELPAGTKFVTSSERDAQLKARAASYAPRYTP